METFKSRLGRIGVGALLVCLLAEISLGSAERPLNKPPKGFKALFNGKDLTGWKGLVGNPKSRANMSRQQLAKAQEKADADMRSHWKVEDGALAFDGGGHSLCTAKDYADFEMLVDWKIEKGGDSGIYLRGSPQVQIWDTANRSVGAQVGSGGLYNNQKGRSKPLKVADKPIGQWNRFRIIMVGDVVTVYLNDVLVVDNVVMENYWERNKPIYPVGQIELQSHGSRLYFRNVFIREILSAEEKKEGFAPLFNGLDMSGWTGNTTSYYPNDGAIVCDPKRGGGGNLYTAEEYGNFVFRFEFRLTPGANNGLGIRTPKIGDAAYQGMELQILDNTADKYKNLRPYQYHGSIYGVFPAKRGYLKPVGEWNYQEVTANGKQITVKLNGTTIVNEDISESKVPKAVMDRHPGLKREKGYISFCGHGDYLEFRNIRIKSLD